MSLPDDWTVPDHGQGSDTAGFETAESMWTVTDEPDVSDGGLGGGDSDQGSIPDTQSAPAGDASGIAGTAAGDKQKRRKQKRAAGRAAKPAKKAKRGRRSNTDAVDAEPDAGDGAPDGSAHAKSTASEASASSAGGRRRRGKSNSRRGDVWDDFEELKSQRIAEADAETDADSQHSGDRESPPSRKRKRKERRQRRSNADAAASDTGRDARTAVGKPSHAAKAVGNPKKAAKQRRSGNADRRAERNAENELRRRLKKLKAPKESRAARSAARQASQSDSETSPGGTKRATDKKTQKHTPQLGTPPKGTASVMVVDGGHASLMLLRGGRVTAASTETYGDPVSAVESVARLNRVDRLVWCNEIEAKVIGAAPAEGNSREQALIREIHAAQSLIDAFGKRSLLGTLDTTPGLVAKPIGVGISDRWAKHRLIRKHTGRVVVPAQCHGRLAGIWLRVGWAWSEAAYADKDGHTLDWVRVPGLKLPPNRVGGEDIDVGSGLDGRRAAQERLGDQGPTRWLNHIVEQISGQTADWGRQITPAETIWIHGPGTQTPGLEEALEAKARVRVQRPPVDLLEQAAVDVDQIITATNAWSREPLGNPSRVLARARRRRAARIARKGIYAAAVLAVLAALSAWIGAGRSAAIAAAEQRKAAAEAQVTTIQEQTLPPQETLITGARNLLGCPNEILDSGGSDNPDDGAPQADADVVAVPVDYDPAVWPDGWQTAFLAIGDSITAAAASRQFDAAVLTGPQIAAAQQLAAESSTDAENGEAWDDDEITDRFAAAGLNVGQWRTAAWARTAFDGHVPYLPPRGPRLCAAPVKNLLWEAQNAALMPLLVAEQMNAQGGWIITEPEPNPGGTLEQAHQTYELEDMSVFVAWLAHQPDMADTLAPLAWALWGERGVVRVDEPFERRCEIGVHPQTGAPLRICGSEVSVRIGPAYLVEAESTP